MEAMGAGRGGQTGHLTPPWILKKLKITKGGMAGEKANKTKNIYNITEKYLYIFIPEN